MGSPSMFDTVGRTWMHGNIGYSKAQERKNLDAAKFAYNPDDPSIRNPHPHGKASYDHVGDMQEFQRRVHPENIRKGFDGDNAKNRDTPLTSPAVPTCGGAPPATDSATPTRSSSNTAPVPPNGTQNPALNKGSNPLIPIPFYCYRDGKLSSVDIYCKTVPTPV
jgi:hypothetical protein